MLVGRSCYCLTDPCELFPPSPPYSSLYAKLTKAAAGCSLIFNRDVRAKSIVVSMFLPNAHQENEDVFYLFTARWKKLI